MTRKRSKGAGTVSPPIIDKVEDLKPEPNPESAAVSVVASPVEDVRSVLEDAGADLPRDEFYRIRKFMVVEKSRQGEGKGHSPLRLGGTVASHGDVFDRDRLLSLLSVKGDLGTEEAEARLLQLFYVKERFRAVA